jgi:hypothetical protein
MIEVGKFGVQWTDSRDAGTSSSSMMDCGRELNDALVALTAT